MSLSAYVDDLNIKVEMIPLGRIYRPVVRTIKPTSITIHNTDNTDPGADADAHSKFVRNTGFYKHNGKIIKVSWHYVVDDQVCIQQLPLTEGAWHAHSAANGSSLAIEVCMHQGIDQAQADDRAARLAAYLLYTHSFDTNAVKTHKDWTDKNCPSKLLGNWSNFLTQVETYLAELAGTEVAAFDGGRSFQLHGAHWDDIES